jgi:hypothetical protein
MKAWLQGLDWWAFIRAVLGLGAALSALDWLLYDKLGFWGPAIVSWWALVELWEWGVTSHGCISLITLTGFIVACMFASYQSDHHRPDYD